jgi:hypothetical protein
MSAIISETEVKRYLPENLPTNIDTTAIDAAIDGAQAYLQSRLSPEQVDSGGDLDKLIVTLLAAVEIRDQITGLSDAFGSRTKGMQDRAEKMILARIAERAGGDDRNPLPVGAGGREAEGKKEYPIFGIPRPRHDENAGRSPDDQTRPSWWK